MSIPQTNWQQKVYSRFRGVDFSTDATNIDETRASDALNMIADEAGFPTKRVGWRILARMAGGRVNGLHYLPMLQGFGYIFAHVGTHLYAFPIIRRLRNVLPDALHGDEEYTSSFRPTAAHIIWMRAYIAGTAQVSEDWQVNNADEDDDGTVSNNDLALLTKAMSFTHDAEGTYQDTGRTMKNAPSASFECEGCLYILDGENYIKITRTKQTIENVTFYNAFTIENVVGTIPTTGTNGYYKYEELDDGTLDAGTWQDCTPYDEANYLQSKQINTMAGDGSHKEFWLTSLAASINKVEIMNSSGTWVTTTAYSTAVDGTRTKITFTSAPAIHPDGAGLDNIRVTFTPTATLDPTKITHCTIATRYGFFNNNRVFFSGNPDYPNMDFMSGIDDPAYFPENGFTKVGSEYTRIRGYLHYGDILAIVKEQDNFEPEIYIRSSEEQADSSVLFPVQQGVTGVGAASARAFATLRDDPLFYAPDGVYAIAGTDASQQRTVQNRSFFVDARLRTERGEPIAVVWGDRYVLCFPQSGHCYIADAKQTVYNSNYSFIYEWYYWENIPACRFLEIDGALFFGTIDGRLCRFNDDIDTLDRFSDGMEKVNGEWTEGNAIPAYWMTKKDSLTSLSQTKSLSRKGCAVMVKPYERSSLILTAESDRTLVNKTVDLVDNEITTTVFPFEKSLKRFTTLRLKFENNTLDEGFGLYGVQLRFVNDRYVK